MGRAPCCDKANVKKGPWSPEEDAKLKTYIEQHGTGGNWIALPQKIGLKRCGKSCRLRWLNYLRPNIKHGGFSEEEDNIICSLYINIGSRWSIIAAQLPGRTDNDIKNYWNTKLKKKLLGKQRKEQASRRASLKQEMLMKRETDQSLLMASPPLMMNYQAAFNWTEMAPLNVPPQQMSQDANGNFMSQESLMNLLVKNEGRFSDDDDHHHLQDLNMAAESIIMFSSSSASSLNSMETNYSTTVNGSVATEQEMFQGLLEGLVPEEIEAMVAFYSNQQESQSFGSFLYGSMDMSNAMSISTGTSGISSNYLHHQLASEYEISNCLQSRIITDQGSSPFDDSRLYFVPQ